LTPAEEQLDRPALSVEVGDQLGRGSEVIGRDAQDLAAVDPHPHFTDPLVERVLATVGLPFREKADPVGEDVGALREGDFRLFASLAALGSNDD
jgi:hypothetical protein